MIPRAQIVAWRAKAPWSTDAQVEQDLVLSRALVEIYSDDDLRHLLAFRGGTALHKLYLNPPARYSEDLDFVQLRGAPAGDMISAIRRRLDPWLGTPRRARSAHTVTLTYGFSSEIAPVTPLRLKIEINSREHFNVLGHEMKVLDVENAWFSGRASVRTYALEELLGTKLRALYQRSKGRDLFDLAVALERAPELNRTAVIRCFTKYAEHQGVQISRAQLRENLAAKLQDPGFGRDVEALLCARNGRVGTTDPGEQSIRVCELRCRGRRRSGTACADRSDTVDSIRLASPSGPPVWLTGFRSSQIERDEYRLRWRGHCFPGGRAFGLRSWHRRRC